MKRIPKGTLFKMLAYIESLPVNKLIEAENLPGEDSLKKYAALKMYADDLFFTHDIDIHFFEDPMYAYAYRGEGNLLKIDKHVIIRKKIATK